MDLTAILISHKVLKSYDQRTDNNSNNVGKNKNSWNCQGNKDQLNQIKIKSIILLMKSQLQCRNQQIIK